MISQFNSIDWRGWKITEQQINLIKSGDISARDTFYFDNYERIKKMAKHYVYKRNLSAFGRAYDYEDCVSGVYLDISMFSFESGRNISLNIINSFFYSIYGGWLYVAEQCSKLRCAGYRGEQLCLLDSPIRSDLDYEKMFIDFYASSPSPEELLIDSENIGTCNLIEITRNFLSPRENEILSLFLDGYSVYAIPEVLGLKNVTRQYARIKERLRANFKDVLIALEKLGLIIPSFAQAPPEDYEKCLLSIKKENEKQAVWAKKRRLAKKEEQNKIA